MAFLRDGSLPEDRMLLAQVIHTEYHNYSIRLSFYRDNHRSLLLYLSVAHRYYSTVCLWDATMFAAQRSYVSPPSVCYTVRRGIFI
jgi:hypothetical protein